MKIAVCDDNPKHINAIENSLFEISKARNIKIDCDAYQSGEELAAAYQTKSERYDVIFLDMETDGLIYCQSVSFGTKTCDFCISIVYIDFKTECSRCFFT